MTVFTHNQLMSVLDGDISCDAAEMPTVRRVPVGWGAGDGKGAGRNSSATQLDFGAGEEPLRTVRRRAQRSAGGLPRLTLARRPRAFTVRRAVTVGWPGGSRRRHRLRVPSVRRGAAVAAAVVRDEARAAESGGRAAELGRDWAAEAGDSLPLRACRRAGSLAGELGRLSAVRQRAAHDNHGSGGAHGRLGRPRARGAAGILRPRLPERVSREPHDLHLWGDPFPVDACDASGGKRLARPHSDH